MLFRFYSQFKRGLCLLLTTLICLPLGPNQAMARVKPPSALDPIQNSKCTDFSRYDNLNLNQHLTEYLATQDFGCLLYHQWAIEQLTFAIPNSPEYLNALFDINQILKHYPSLESLEYQRLEDLSLVLQERWTLDHIHQLMSQPLSEEYIIAGGSTEAALGLVILGFLARKKLVPLKNYLFPKYQLTVDGANVKKVNKAIQGVFKKIAKSIAVRSGQIGRAIVRSDLRLSALVASNVTYQGIKNDNDESVKDSMYIEPVLESPLEVLEINANRQSISSFQDAQFTEEAIALISGIGLGLVGDISINSSIKKAGHKLEQMAMSRLASVFRFIGGPITIGISIVGISMVVDWISDWIESQRWASRLQQVNYWQRSLRAASNDLEKYFVAQKLAVASAEMTAYLMAQTNEEVLSETLAYLKLTTCLVVQKPAHINGHPVKQIKPVPAWGSPITQDFYDKFLQRETLSITTNIHQLREKIQPTYLEVSANLASSLELIADSMRPELSTIAVGHLNALRTDISDYTDFREFLVNLGDDVKNTADNVNQAKINNDYFTYKAIREQFSCINPFENQEFKGPFRHEPSLDK